MDSFALIIFGITSNLSQIKLIPALYDMEEEGILPASMKVVGIARSPKTDQEIRDFFKVTLKIKNKHHPHPYKKEVVDRLIKRINYLDGNLDDPVFYKKLKQYLDELSSKNPDAKNRVFYLATYPELYRDIFENLKKTKLDLQKEGFVRLIIEKPIGTDYKSAKKINKLLLNYFDEDQIYRLDHYLGKETLQNILTFRFGNEIFEPLLNKDYVDHIQITAAEDLGIGKRGGYYDQIGALRDVGQNHQLQMIAFTTMEAPSEFSNKAITLQRIKVLERLVPLPKSLVFGQYIGYKDEESVNPKSKIDTYYAFKTLINLKRWKNVPIYVRAGKKLKRYVTEIVVVFKSPNNRLFKHLHLGQIPNMLIYRIFPNEGIVLNIITKKPGQKLELESEFMQFCYRSTTKSHHIPDPYQKLLIDAMSGDQTFFNDAKEIEAEWRFIDKLVPRRLKPVIYPPENWGPKEADELLAKDGRAWIEPSEDFCRI